MKKNTITAIILIFVMLLSILTSCSDNKVVSYKIIDPKDYQVFGNGNDVGLGSNGDDPVSINAGDLIGAEILEKENQGKREFVIGGEKKQLLYSYSWKNRLCKDDMDVYITDYEDRLLAVSYNMNTGKIVDYYRFAPCTDRNYQSEVNSKSTEEEFISYVKKILAEQTGVSVEDRVLKISTELIRDGKSTTESGFVKNENDDPDFFAIYSFSFCLYIDGIARMDRVFVSISSMGELAGMEVRKYDEAYKPYENIKFDKDKVISKVETVFPHRDDVGNPIVSHETRIISVIPSEDGLWAEVAVSFDCSYGRDADSGEEDVYSSLRFYYVKVAELIEE